MQSAVRCFFQLTVSECQQNQRWKQGESREDAGRTQGGHGRTVITQDVSLGMMSNCSVTRDVGPAKPRATGGIDWIERASDRSSDSIGHLTAHTEYTPKDNAFIDSCASYEIKDLAC